MHLWWGFSFLSGLVFSGRGYSTFLPRSPRAAGTDAPGAGGLGVAES